MDVVTAEKRSSMMSGIRSKNTKGEIVLRKILYSGGYRYRLNIKTITGNPDIYIPRKRAAIFFNGCFWHGHQCHFFRIPSTNQLFWSEKIRKNIERDNFVMNQLFEEGYRIAIIWECSMRGKKRIGDDKISSALFDWLESEDKKIEIMGAK